MGYLPIPVHFKQSSSDNFIILAVFSLKSNIYHFTLLKYNCKQGIAMDGHSEVGVRFAFRYSIFE